MQAASGIWKVEGNGIPWSFQKESAEALVFHPSEADFGPLALEL